MFWLQIPSVAHFKDYTTNKFILKLHIFSIFVAQLNFTRKMADILAGTEQMLAIIVVACVIVMFAMVIDLCSGLYKAKQRHELRSSWGLKRTLTKFITYEGGMLIAAGVDYLMHLCNLLHLFRLEAIYGVPVVTCLLGIFLLVVEFISVREAADDKTKTEFARVSELASKMVNKEELIEALTKAIIEARKKEEPHGTTSD